MRLTFVNDRGQNYVRCALSVADTLRLTDKTQDIEIDPQMELENILALLEAEVRVYIYMCYIILCSCQVLVGHPHSRAKHLNGGSRIE